MTTITYNNKIYPVNFGLKGLIILAELSYKLTGDKVQDLPFVLYCGLISHYPDISFSQIKEILQGNSDISLDIPAIPTQLEVQELYTKAVGEMGISPNDFYQMTPQEIEWAYEGYLRRKETEANLMKIAFMSDNDELIRLTEDKGYSIGNLEEREKTLQMFNREEIENGL